MTDQLEFALIERCKRGDQNSFKELFDMYKDKVYSTAIRMLKNEEDAEDASQETFIKVFKNIHSFRSDSSLNSWIYRITINTCLDRLKGKNNIEQNDTDELSAISSLEKPSGAIQIIIENEIQKLPKGCKTVFILHAIEGFKHDEVAKILDISPGTSKSQYFTAKSILRKKLVPYMEYLSNEM